MTPRKKALEKGEKFYEGKLCGACGKSRIRYTANWRCVECSNSPEERWKQKLRRINPQLPDSCNISMELYYSR